MIIPTKYYYLFNNYNLLNFFFLNKSLYLIFFFKKKLNINFYLKKKIMFKHNFFLNFFKFFLIVSGQFFNTKQNFYIESKQKFNFFNLLLYSKNIKTFFNFIYYSCIEKKNFLILDNSKTYLFPLYNYLYSYKNIAVYKNFFFLSWKYFTYRNWVYFYSSFLKKFNIRTLVLFDLIRYFNYIREVKLLSVFLISIVFIENIFIKVDFYLFSTKNLYFITKYFYLLILLNSFFLSLQNKQINHQLNFFKKLI